MLRLTGEILLAGLAGVVVLKVIGGLLLPLLGLAMGLVAVAVKVLVFGAIAYMAYSFFRRRREKKAWS